MEATSDIQWMREENIDGEAQEEADEEETCKGESQNQIKVQSEEGSEEIRYTEGCQEDCQEGSQETGCQDRCQESHQEDCQETQYRRTQSGSEEICGDDQFSRYVQTGGSSLRQEICEAIRRGGASETLVIAADGVGNAEGLRS
jgi:hypothetical protein